MAQAISPIETVRGRHPRDWMWPTVVVMLLAGQVAVCGVIIFASSVDPTVAVEPNYYEKAMAWDQQATQREQDRVLGWSAVVTADALTDTAGGRAVQIELRDRENAAIRGATVRATVFHHVRAQERFETELPEADEGRYAARLPLRRNGLWEFRIHAQRGGDVFTVVRELTVGMSGSAAK